MVIVSPKYNKEETFSLDNFDVERQEGYYSLANGFVAYVYRNNLYVTRCTNRSYWALANFKEACFYVPFSDGSYPKDNKSAWERVKWKSLED